MNFFSIRDMEKMSGIKAHTFRIWEQRYNLIRAKRKESKHRFYDNEDLKYILRIAYLYNQGYKISQIAQLGDEAIKKLALQTRAGVENYQIFVNQLTEASIDFDQVRFEKVLNNLIMHIGFDKSVTQVLFPLLNKLGILWMTDSVIPSQEHFASTLIVKKIMIAIDGIETPKSNGSRRVLLFTPENEYHEIPLLFMQYLLRKNSVSHIYIGTNVLIKTIEDYCSQQDITELYFHCISNLQRYELSRYLKKLSGIFADKEIYFSGPRTYLESLPGNVKFLKTPEEMLEFCTFSQA